MHFLQGPTGCAQMLWRNSLDGYLRQILNARVYDVAVSATFDVPIAMAVNCLNCLHTSTHKTCPAMLHKRWCTKLVRPRHSFCLVPVQEQTPLEQAAWLTEVTSNNFLLKREDLQPVRPLRMQRSHSRFQYLQVLMPS